IKFTENGHVRISAQHVPATKAVEFKVADTGIGIPKEALRAIFEKFVQKDSSGTRCYGGVGMGLYIVKAFTELLRGTVAVQSEPDHGSNFTVSLPVVYEEAKRSDRRPTSSPFLCTP
ncbi:MAG: ATP-binding protein, partial [Acidobacteriota bacterium]